MKRFLAKQLVQYYYDTQSFTDPLPRWLRRFVDRDAKLVEWEREICRLEFELREQRERFFESFVEQNVEASSEQFRFAESPRSFGNDPSQKSLSGVNHSPLSFGWRHWGMTALTATAACCILLLVWGEFGWETGDKKSKAGQTIGVAEANGRQKDLGSEVLLHSSLAIKKKWSERWTERRKELNSRMELIDQSVVDDMKDIGRQGLHFVTYKVPVSAVRMVLEPTDRLQSTKE